MHHLHEEAKNFGARKLAETALARQVAAARLICGIDLADAVAAAPDIKARLIARVERILERERLKGLRRHWSYDLNRHIALKQALDTMRGADGGAGSAIDKSTVLRTAGARNPGGARGRRRRDDR